ncbi:hypothetical protein CA850_26765 [Micromonospora echinospora]|uniref:Uncharacterized protein n=1 Tax=Micromonospora echinospora TaxID=1877 RepID=A0A1C4VTA3_MICEC|nr:hypothetical protein [Micromonospora echinospora]OZV76453.1 hypothetical protein CA850_26765 [Micromonospora echinospora]SCE87197.1 hypothetical protein GA0070618_1542 [Micromonospora echinospora]
MRTETDSRAGDARRVWPLTAIQLLLVAAYAYAAVAYLTTDADFFPEQSPPGWSWPAVVVVGIGFVPALLCLAVALPRLASTRLRAERSSPLGLAVASALTVLMLVVMATPPGWELFDWYVS